MTPAQMRAQALAHVREHAGPASPEAGRKIRAALAPAATAAVKKRQAQEAAKAKRM
jgi:hypothetical protein